MSLATPSPSSLTGAFDLSEHNTLGLAARALHGGFLTEPQDVAAAHDFASRRGLPFHLLGGGSNCVLAPEIEAVVGLVRLRGRSLDRSTPDLVRVTARAGESWADLVAWTVAQGIGGLENLAGIPGTVGAAPIQNIGAYGIELADVFDHLTALEVGTGRRLRFDRAACRFAYRHSRFKEAPGRYMVCDVTLALPQPWRPVLGYAGLDALDGPVTPRRVMEAVLALRSAKLPDWRRTGNAGSFFHNPILPAEAVARLPEMPSHPVEGGIKLSAGWLLEAAGLKGARHGGAGFSDQHALVLVNHGGATFEDVTALAARAVRTVETRFGVTLVQEPVTLR
ncbi:UDP-N-acetylmuramate dehydrogenase [Celeribacter indicus]|uniref:UDP-N-acetylenolpyruvoylglucosamine reductase n=1 Tax=Celeribacter indicus TaxID=1208324 RepID=A0A0B5E6F5_9RHOB|nr:UDP-N-acetylmuramate dehydrogenase [Celeribacter indicus]AJE49030.1 UDP-N-acetylenolpyruvoylglucosamine reductase [Celeribacter indicus]SDW44136.1 UDP-N-acetylmuramate dehydrogenase [Celeribacter indicus]